ncbi:MAG: T9SS type A sorting domain-containing protein [Salinivirgaceae bacterium]|jgi:hypothetical protein|nr:T9SS type A sorting domain-containing protein [Salinivirgaceae bacterium]
MKNKLLLSISAFLLITYTAQITRAQLVDPQFTDGKYKLEVANISFVITPEIGARFSSLKIDGTEILYIEEGSGNWGSSFWPSPQNDWLWPPPNALDTDPYTGGIIGKKIWLTSKTDEETNLSFSKTVYGDLADNSINIEYVMINQKDEPQTYAPWEVTRVPSGGWAFFPAGDTDITGNMAESAITIGDYVWYDNSSSIGSKFFSDSKGWLAHIDKKRNLFIKVFDDISIENAAPDEAEVEVYSGGNYVELENQGAYKPIAANDSITWKVKWFVRQLPTNIDITFGNQSLIDYTISVINNTAPNSIKKNYAIDLSIYPNPTSANIYISNSNLNAQFYRICNINGQIVKQDILSQQTIDISSLKKGVYIIKINDKETQHIGRLMIQ